MTPKPRPGTREALPSTTKGLGHHFTSPRKKRNPRKTQTLVSFPGQARRRQLLLDRLDDLLNHRTPCEPPGCEAGLDTAPESSTLETETIPTGASAVEEATTLSTPSARLVAAEEGLIGQTQDSMLLGGCPDPYVSLEASGHQETRSPNPTTASYDAANPYARPPPLPERLPEPLPGPGVRPFYPPQPDVSQGDNYVKYNNTGWYVPWHGPYPPMPYISPHYHYPYPPGNLHDPMFHPQSVYTVHGDPNAVRYHDTYYNGTNYLYPSYPGHPLYPFYPPLPPLPRAGPVSRPDGHENPLLSAHHPQNDSGSDKEVLLKGTNQNA
ncbi:hypothetical protein SCLCIDRAFT_1217341 [Scleroderma citrinum Foug A]|uniref:Uncharacterized protein n=1 Tax=Scleroderma citrinum Foug A TaxID=1036808 RepID=A0A0C3DUP2_9AGAM|nr:hypothetical protein SCLCIDRAFT_1217341 [Scleroderma citrinum Foug A]